MTTDKLKEFERALQGHDWYFDYTDDHSVWRRGWDQSVRINELRDELTKSGAAEAAEQLWQQYCPFTKEQH